MLKQAVVDGIALDIPQEVVLDLKSMVPVRDCNGQPIKRISLVDEQTHAFQLVYEKHKPLLNQRLESNKESAQQFEKVTVSVPNIVLNSFQQLKQDSLPLIVAMLAQVYHQVDKYHNELAKALKDNSPTSDTIKSLVATNPVDKNFFFLPYHLVGTLLNFQTIDLESQVDKFTRASAEIRKFVFPLHFNVKRHVEKGEQNHLLTTLVGNLDDLHEGTINAQAFENCFYWVHDKKEYMGFTIAPDFRNLLLLLMGELTDGSKISQLLPYTRIDWHFLRFLPARNNIRQMYLFIKSNIYNTKNKMRVQEATFEYSLDDLKRFMGVDKESCYSGGDAHFVRDKIRNAVAELSKTPGCEYNITISKRNIKTPGGLKKQIIEFDVKVKRSFVDSHKAVLKHIKMVTNADGFNNDWLVFSCIRYCTVEQLCARIDSAYKGFLNAQKKLGLSKKFDHLTIETQINRYLSDDLQKYWQELAAAMVVENPHSSHSRLLKKVAIGEGEQTKIFSSPAAQAVQARKRGRPRKDQSTAPKVKLSKEERELLEKMEAAKLKEKAVPADDTGSVEENTQEIQSETIKPPVLVQQDLLSDQNDDNVIVFPKDQVISEEDQIADEIAQANAEQAQELENDYRVDAPANFTAPPPVEIAPWEAYNEHEVGMEMNHDAYSLEDFETFIINTDNLVEHLQPVNGNTDHYAWVNDYLEHMNNDHQSDINSLFYDLFNLTAILNIIEHDNKQFQSRYVKYIDLYREKLNIVFQTLFKFYGTYEQRNDQTSVYSYLVEKTAEFLFESPDISPEQRMFTRGLFVRLAEAIKAEKRISLKEFYSLRGQCVAYPFTE